MVLFDDFVHAKMLGYLSILDRTCTCGSRAESFLGRMQVGSALAWHSYACIRAGMSALELLLGLGGWPPRHSFMHPQLAVHVGVVTGMVATKPASLKD